MVETKENALYIQYYPKNLFIYQRKVEHALFVYAPYSICEFR